VSGALPGPGFSCELSEPYFSEDHVYGKCFAGTSLRTNVYVKATTEALTALATNKGLRRLMWAAGWARACDVNDLRHIIPQYEEFWSKLGEIRKRSTDVSTEGWPYLSYPNLFARFQNLPSASPQNEYRIATIASNDYAKVVFVQCMNIFRSGLLLEAPSLIRLIQLLRCDGELTVANAVTESDDAPKVMRSLGWLLKMRVCVLIPNLVDVKT
jgi:hypothetical protein